MEPRPARGRLRIVRAASRPSGSDRLGVVRGETVTIHRQLIGLAAALVLVAPAAVVAATDQPEGGAAHGMTAAPVAPVPVVLLRRSAKPLPPGATGDALVRANLATDDIARRASRVMLDPDGFGQFALRLDRRARTLLLRDPATPGERRAVLLEPAYLFLSDRQGGFPAESFWLEQPDGALREKRGVPFVDTVVDEHDLDPGTIDGLEEIFAHELGHLVMAALAGPAPRRASSATHFVTVRTDAWTAFVEGWGEHFQPLGLDRDRAAASAESTVVVAAAESTERERIARAREAFWYPRFAREQVEGCVICPANLRLLWWQGPGEQSLRDGALRVNRFIRQVELPARLRGDGRPAFEARMYRDVVPPSDGGPMKNASQMLSSEGVVATFFYRLVTDARLRSAYRDPAFYAPFISEEEAALMARLGPASVVPAPENAYLKLFEVMHRSFQWGDWPALEIVRAYAARFPDEAGAVYDVFLEVTRGVTVETAAPARHNEPGYLADLRERLLAGRARLDGNVGPPLWVAVPGLHLGMGVFRYFLVPAPYTFDLNAADATDLRSVPGVSAALAAAIVDARDRRGWFARLDDLGAVPGVTPDLLARFRSMHAQMQERMNRPRQRTSDPGWLKDYLALVLKGSYYAAAAWQLGSALLIAGLGFAFAWWAAGKVVPGGRMAAGGNNTDREETGAPRRQVRGGPVRRWMRAAVVALVGGAAAAVVPTAVSLALYGRGVMPTALNMAAAGLVIGIAFTSVAVIASTARRRTGTSRSAAMRFPVFDRRSALRVIASSVVASLVVGLLY